MDPDRDTYEMMLTSPLGSGIYVSPAIVLKSTGSVGLSLLLWSVGPIVSMSALLCWLELGLSIPKFEIPNTNSAASGREGETIQENVPYNGGEKNYVGVPVPVPLPCVFLSDSIDSLSTSINRRSSAQLACME